MTSDATADALRTRAARLDRSLHARLDRVRALPCRPDPSRA